MKNTLPKFELIPDYYSAFTCIADQCPFTCCQEWKIGVDADTNRRWKKLQPPEAVCEQKKNLSAYTVKKDGQRVIGLDDDRRCPFLDSRKLCRLVLTYGDQVLSETCATFPREEHRFKTHTEKSLMPGCPAVINLWKERGILDFPKVKELPLSIDSSAELFFLLREKLLSLFADSSKSIEEELLEFFYILKELDRVQPLSEETVEEYFAPETVAELGQAIAEVDLPEQDMIRECNELLLDLSVNYRKEGMYQEALRSILVLAEEISGIFSDAQSADRPGNRENDQSGEQFDNLTNNQSADQQKNRDNVRLIHETELLSYWPEYSRQLKVYAPLLRSFLQNEIFSDLLLPDSDLESILVQMQWIGLEYAVVRHSIFLKWLSDGREELTYETVREYLVVLTRMTGYENADIYEYLENNFASLLWDWSYFALITGK